MNEIIRADNTAIVLPIGNEDIDSWFEQECDPAELAWDGMLILAEGVRYVGSYLAHHEFGAEDSDGKKSEIVLSASLVEAEVFRDPTKDGCESEILPPGSRIAIWAKNRLEPLRAYELGSVFGFKVGKKLPIKGKKSVWDIKLSVHKRARKLGQ
jgi:hypothetical protein